MHSQCTPIRRLPCDLARAKSLAGPPRKETAPLSPDSLADLRARAAVEPWPWGGILAAAADWYAADADAYRATVAGDDAALDAAILARCAAGARWRELADAAATASLAGLALAMQLRRGDVRRLLVRAMRKDLRELAEAVVALERKRGGR
jgi:hypothetical protein